MTLSNTLLSISPILNQLDEGEKLKIIGLTAQLSLDQVEQQQLDWNTAVDLNSQSTEDYTSDEQKRQIPR